MSFIDDLRIIGPALLLALTSTPGWSAECPPGSSLLGVSQSETQRTTSCQCAQTHVARNNQCVLKMPVVDPAFFVSPNHTAFINNELALLQSRKARFERELAKLDRLRERQGEYLAQMDEMREQIIYDSVGDLLGLVSSKAFVDRIPGLSPGDAAELERGTQALKAAVEGAPAALAGQDRSRAREKVVSAAGTTLSLVAKLSIPEKQKEVVVKLIEASAELVKTANTVRETRDMALRERTVKILDNLFGVAGAVYEPIGIARSTINVAGGTYVAWRIQGDKESIVEALVSSQRAKLAFDQRLAATNDLIKFYEIELKKGQR
jgi:hypothetical protein